MDAMITEIVQRLNALNREFYQTFSGSFSTTRYNVQPGVQRILDGIAKDVSTLDLGCGNGNILLELKKREFSGSYTGTDFSESLIRTAKEKYASMAEEVQFKAEFQVVDLLSQQEMKTLKSKDFDVVTAFASFHHIPGKHVREQLFSRIYDLMSHNTLLIFSVWQPQNSPRLRKRFLPWETIDLEDKDVDPGDILLDWKAEQEEHGRVGYRFVHIYSENELQSLADQIGFHIEESFYSDGKEGNIGLYQVWRKLE